MSWRQNSNYLKMIAASKLFEVFEYGNSKSKKLCTINLTPDKNVYGEKIINIKSVYPRSFGLEFI